MKIKRVTAYIIMITILSAMIPTYASPDGVSTDTSTVEGWTFTSSYSDSSINIVEDSPLRGKSVKLENNTVRVKDNYAALSTKVSLSEGKTYCLEFEAKTENGKACDVMFNWSPRWSLIPVTASYDWKPFKFTYMPETSGIYDLRFILDNKTDGLWLDNIKLYDMAESSVNMVPNSNFENSVLTAEQLVSKKDESQDISPNFFAERGTMTIDGKTDDWEGIEKYNFTSFAVFIAGSVQKSKPMISCAFDDEFVYLLCQVDDPIHISDELSFYKGDSFQAGFAKKKSDPKLVERNIALFKSGEIYKGTNDINAAITRDGTITTYEMAVPWASIGSEKPLNEVLLNAALNVNDGNGRESAWELSPGITQSKDPSAFNWLHLWMPLGNIEQCVETTDIITIGEKGGVKVHLRNPGNREETVNIVSEKLGYKESVKLNPGEERIMPIDIITDIMGVSDIEVKLESGGEEYTSVKSVDIRFNYERYQKFDENLSQYIKELKELIHKCEEKGMKVDYEVAYYSLICQFRNTIAQEAKAGKFERMVEYERALTKIFEATKASLSAYLKGEKKPLNVPKYISSDIEFDGTNIIGNTFDGKEENRRPVFFTGYMSIDYAALELLPEFSPMGFNTTQIGVNPKSYMCNFDPHIVDGWYHFAIGTYSTEIGITDEASASGKHSIKIVNPDAYKNDNYRRFTNYIDVKPNTTYKWGFKAKGKNINKTWFNPNNRTWYGYEYISDSEDWKSYDFEFTTGPEQTQVELTFASEDKTEVVYIDDVYFNDTNGKNLVVNGSFEDTIPREKSELDKNIEKYGWYINYYALDRLCKGLDAAERHNAIVDLMCGVDIVPAMIYAQDPTMNESTTQFIPFTVDSEISNTFVRTIAKITADIANKYDCVKSICITNEPTVNSWKNDHYNYLFHAYLKEIYNNDIDALNQCYGSEYSSFEDVRMPTTGVEQTALWHDSRNFNDKLFKEYFEAYAKDVKEYLNDDKYSHIKIMDYFRYNWEHYVQGGTNWENVASSFDVNGCDAHSYYTDQGRTPMPLKMGWYDFMTSVKDAPVFDTETHIVHDIHTVQYDDITPHYFYSDIWNGAVHGCGNKIIWYYDTVATRNAIGGSNYANAGLNHRPASMAMTAKAGLDLQRLSKEVAALQNAEHKIGLMYSWSNLSWNENYMPVVADAYKDIIFSGQNVGMVTDSKPENIHKYKLIIIPEMQNVTRQQLLELKKYLDNGGEVLILGENSLKYDEYHKELPMEQSAISEYIYSVADVQNTVSDKIAQMNLSDVVLVDAVTGARLDDVEWSYAEYNGKILVNILNYSFEEDRNLKVLYKDMEITEFTELINMNKLSGAIYAKRYQPILLQFDI